MDLEINGMSDSSEFHPYRAFQPILGPVHVPAGGTISLLLYGQVMDTSSKIHLVLLHADGNTDTLLALDTVERGWRRLEYLSPSSDNISLYIQGESPANLIYSGFTVTRQLPSVVNEGLTNNSSASDLFVSENPFTGLTTIRLHSIGSAMTELTVVNTLGVVMARLMNGELTAGDYQYVLDAHTWAAGVYLVFLKSGDDIVTKRILKLP